MAVASCSNNSAENQFERLVIALKDALGTSGLTSDDIDVRQLTRLMKEYQSNEEEWGRFALADPRKEYTRNLVDQGNGKSNLVSLHTENVSLPPANREAYSCLDTWQGEPHTQSQQRALSDEDSAGPVD